MTAHGLRVVSSRNGRRHIHQIGIFDSIISSSSKLHAGRRLASRPVRHSLDWNHRGAPTWTQAAALLSLPLQPYGTAGRAKELAPCAMTPERVLPTGRHARIRTNSCTEAAKPKNSSGSSRGTERFFDGISKKHCIVTFHARAIPTSEVGDDETGSRSTCDYKRPGNTNRHCRPIGRPVQPPAKYANFSPNANATGSHFAGAKNHIRNINRRQNLFDIS